ncbi:capsular polysaccharide export protein, LipB/KpsS family [Lacrimispora sp.]|jgi:hypothetical protein|uniref:capsular polysaccharide export protein, LipB/KpsS family n=1 Tax=Lacrimispora sp. TaxID=2719234 RepID=UPI0028B0A41F|nr:hypothetical protein [Lacrimispora sp.]
MSNETIGICFLARPCFDKYSTAIYKSMIDLNCKVLGSFITSNEKESETVVKALEGEKIEIYEVSRFFEAHWNEFTFDKFVEYENEYECAPLWKYVYTDRFLINQDYEYCIKITAGYFMFFEKIFSEGGIDFYYDEAIATLQSYIAYIVGKKLGVQYVSQMTARGGLDATYHYFLNDQYQMDMLFNNNYRNCEYSDNEKDKADKYLEEFENKDIKPANMIFTGGKPKFKLSYLLLPLKYLKARMNPADKDKYFYMYYKQSKIVLEPIEFYFRYLQSRKFYKKADYSKKYVYFPLHYQPEASTIVCAQKYEKQLFFIDSWAKSLPADTVLFVKEHYAVLGHRDLSFYKELRKYPNVVLVDPWENSRKLMQNAVAVTTLTGTAGYEAMLLRKPIFLGGEIFFSNAPGVIKVTEIFDNYLKLMDNWKKPSRGDTIQYLCELFRTYYEGNVYPASEACYEKENISNIANSLYCQLNKMRRKEV